MGWFITEGTLSFREEDGSIYTPKASDIFFQVLASNYTDDRYKSLDTDLPGIRFSKISFSPQLELYVNNNCIQCSMFIIRRGKRIDVLFPSQGGVDHIVVDNTWIYINQDYYLAEELMTKAGIDNPANISFSSYVKLLDFRNIYSSLRIEDKVASDIKEECTSLYAEIPPMLNANLYPYQTVGFRWLKYITDWNCGCILGDEMGLGKTMQVIALILDRQNKAETPCLVVAPVSLLENWRREILRFAPSLSVLVHYGGKRTGRYTELLQYEVVVTAYSTLSNDLSMFQMVNWDLLVLDEAQNIKTPTANRTVSVKQMNRRAGIAVTGTPFENHITDLWSILDFVLPGCLGTVNEFANQYPDDLHGAEKIEPFLTALMLRRRVENVAKDLPERVVISQPMEMSDHEAARYEEERQRILESCDKNSATLAVLTKLRMYCTHPFLLEDSIPKKDPTTVSTKYMRLCEILEEIIDNNEKIILFTSYTGMFQIIEQDIPRRFNIPVWRINGETPVAERQEVIDDYTLHNGAALLVLNPRAAGVGLNITAANHVIHYNLEWNPALEDQATARAYRRGQDRTVFVHRLFFADTVEQVVNEKISHKRDMSDAAVIGTTGEEGNRELIIKALEASPLHKEVLE